MKSRFRNQEGQMTVEMVLLGVIFVGVTLMVSQMLKSSGFFRNFVERPADMFRGMIESGVWMPRDQAAANHPNLLKRAGTVRDPNLDLER